MKQVIVVRKDLNMRKGKMIAQGAHASIGAYEKARNWRDEWKTWVTQWKTTGTTKIVVGCNSAEDILILADKADSAKLPFYVVTDVGKTEFKEPTITAMCIGPAPEDKVDIITGELTLL